MNSEFRHWPDIRVFLSVFRNGSTLAASREPGLAQPTVARRVEVLENECGIALLQRDTRGFKPTAEAQALFPFAEAIESAANAFSKQSQDITRRRTIPIAAPRHVFLTVHGHFDRICIGQSWRFV